MNKSINRLFIFLLLIFTISYLGCGKGQVLGEYYLTPAMMETVPYTGTEILYYVSGEDTIELPCFRRVSEVKKEPASISSSDYYNVEYNYTDFYLGPVEMHANLEQSRYNDPRLYLSWIKRDDDYEIVAAGQSNFKLLLSKDNLQEDQQFLDTLTVAGVLYEEVYCDTAAWNQANPGNPEVFYYTEQSGIIRIDFADNTRWELLEIL